MRNNCFSLPERDTMRDYSLKEQWTFVGKVVFGLAAIVFACQIVGPYVIYYPGKIDSTCLDMQLNSGTQALINLHDGKMITFSPDRSLLNLNFVYDGEIDRELPLGVEIQKLVEKEEVSFLIKCDSRMWGELKMAENK